MIIMRPIDEPLVLESLNSSRYGDDVRGFIIMDNDVYMGHALFTVKEDVVNVCECTVKANALIDGAVRACIAAGENAKAVYFTVNLSEDNLKKWLDVFCEGNEKSQIIEHFFKNCK